MSDKLPDGWRWIRLGEVCETNPMSAKAALNLMGLPAGGLRPPLTELSESKKKILKKILEEKGLI